MARIVKKLSDSPKHAPLVGETLARIASEFCENWVTWDVIARFNWGTDKPEEVVRVLAETIGIQIKDVYDAYGKLKAKPEDVKFDPDGDLPREIRLPQQIETAKLDLAKRHEVRVKRGKPAVAVAFTGLDKWFIPEIEECDVKYRFEGLAENATKAQLDIYGSNYTHCSDYAKGLGKYTADTTPFDKIPLFTEDDKIAPVERGAGAFKWKGEVNVREGMLKFKRDGQDKRHVNVAFSPYTAHLRYWKSAGSDKAQLQLLPFWPQFKNDPDDGTNVTLTPAYKPDQPNATSIEFEYENAKDVDSGWLIVKDAQDQVVWRRALKGDELNKGAGKKIIWDGVYDKMALNGLMKPEMLNDSAKTNAEIEEEGYLFRSWPYTFELRTCRRVYKTGGPAADDPSLIKWKIHDADKLTRGLIMIFDKDGKVVWVKGIPKSKLTKGAEHKIMWSGKYASGVKNSKDGKKAIEADMPYRVQIQAHTAENQANGLALAAMHSEVRLYVPKGQYAPKDPRRDLIETPPAMMISRAKHWPRKNNPPVSSGDSKESRLYFQHELTRAGFHPGPVNGVDNDHFKRAVREFKRSVPRDLSAGPGAYTRHSLAGPDLDTLSAEMKDCLGSAALGPKWTRKIWGDRDKIDASSDAPYPDSEEDIDAALADPKKNIVLWVDNRQYYTDTGAPGEFFHAYGPKGVDMKGNMRPVGKKLAVNDPDPSAADGEAEQDRGLRNYRNGMDIGDGAVDHDANFVSQPWAPLKAELRLLGKGDELNPDADAAKVKVDDDDRRAAMRRAIGPLRVDWSVHDALYDVTTINPAQYPAGIAPAPPPDDAIVAEIRTRRYVAGALLASSNALGAHTRADEALPSRFWNCPKTNHMIGKVPADLSKYHREVFPEGDDNALMPWLAVHDDSKEATATFIHDHIAELKDAIPDAAPFPQKEDENLFEPEIGAAGLWFNPSIAAGDGYRLRAEVRFEEVGDYKFPNLKVLKARYPVAPQAQTGEIRLWRRSVMRGYANWAPAGAANASRWTAATMSRVRAQYNVGHTYYVVDTSDSLADVEKTLPALLGDFADADVKRTLRKFVKWHDADNWDPNLDHADMDPDHLWPWSLRDDLGRPGLTAYVGGAGDAADDFLSEFDDQWDRLTGAVLYWIQSRFEAHGMMRGHMIVDFKASPTAQFYKHRCDAVAAHKFISLRLKSAGAPPAAACPACAATMTVTAFGGDVDSINLAAIGLAVGSAWMFRGNIDDFVHEMGHHRHMEHASSAPGPKVDQHDSGANPGVPAVATEIDGNDNLLELQWDRRCVMSYNDRDAQALFPGNPDRPTLLFCGKCAMRIRGWKFAHVASPTDAVREPV